MDFKVECRSPEKTESFARQLGSQLKGGEVLQLIGDVGSGKTTFVRGLAAGIGTKDHVSSPTFTICNTYDGRVTMHHCDFYRLHNDQLIEKELAELIDGQAVVVLEWAESISRIESLEHIIITIKTINESTRTFDVSLPPTYIGFSHLSTISDQI